MAAGDAYIDCSNAKSLLSEEQILRLVLVYDSEGNPALRVYDAAGGGGGGGGVFPTPTTRTASFIREASSANSVPAGARSVTFYNAGSADVDVDGTVLKPGETISFTAGMYDTLAAISYDSSIYGASELVISKVV